MGLAYCYALDKMKAKHPNASDAQLKAWAKSSKDKSNKVGANVASLIDVQIATELEYNKKAIRGLIEKEIDTDTELLECIDSAVDSIREWSNKTFSYDSKNKRMALLKEHNDIYDIVYKTMVNVVQYDDKPEKLTCAVGQCVGYIKGMALKDAVTTMGEIITLMCDADLFDLGKADVLVEDEETGEEYITQSYMVYNPWELSQTLRTRIARSMYLPPMLVPPQILTHNKSSGYLTTEEESLILGRGGVHHNKSICLDSLNRFNQIPLSLNQEMLTEVGDVIDDKQMQAMLDDPKRREQYDNMLTTSYHVYAYLIKWGNKFWLEHKPDKRGRTYAQGYHCSTQGNAFRKAIVELHNKEEVEGEF